MFKLFRRRTGPKRLLKSGPFKAYYSPLFSSAHPGGADMYILFHRDCPAPLATLHPQGRIDATAACADVKIGPRGARKLETLFTRVHRELFRLSDLKTK